MNNKTCKSEQDIFTIQSMQQQPPSAALAPLAGNKEIHVILNNIKPNA